MNITATHWKLGRNPYASLKPTPGFFFLAFLKGSKVHQRSQWDVPPHQVPPSRGGLCSLSGPGGDVMLQPQLLCCRNTITCMIIYDI